MGRLWVVKLEPLAGALGAEIRGVTLTRLDKAGWDEVQRAFLEHSVLGFRDQELEPTDLMRIGAQFGEPCHYPFVTGLEGVPSLFEGLEAEGGKTDAEPGRKERYVSRSHTIRFRDMTEEESKPLVEFLMAHMTRPEFTCRVRWAPGTLTVWDNRCTLHNAVNDYHGQRRRMRRLTVGAQTPV